MMSYTHLPYQYQIQVSLMFYQIGIRLIDSFTHRSNLTVSPAFKPPSISLHVRVESQSGVCCVHWGEAEPSCQSGLPRADSSCLAVVTTTRENYREAKWVIVSGHASLCSLEATFDFWPFFYKWHL